MCLLDKNIYDLLIESMENIQNKTCIKFNRINSTEIVHHRFVMFSTLGSNRYIVVLLSKTCIHELVGRGTVRPLVGKWEPRPPAPSPVLMPVQSMYVIACSATISKM